MRFRIGLMIVLAALVSLGPTEVDAHPGHEHRINGIVVSVTPQQIEVKDGNDIVAIRVNGETKYGRGKKRASLEDIQVGERIALLVITEAPPFTAKEVVLEPPPKPKKPKKS